MLLCVGSTRDREMGRHTSTQPCWPFLHFRQEEQCWPLGTLSLHPQVYTCS